MKGGAGRSCKCKMKESKALLALQTSIFSTARRNCRRYTSTAQLIVHPDRREKRQCEKFARRTLVPLLGGVTTMPFIAASRICRWFVAAKRGDIASARRLGERQ